MKVINPAQFSRIDIPWDKVLARLGFARGKTRLDRKTETLLREEIETAGKLIVPKQVISSSPVRVAGPGKVFLDPGFEIESEKIFQLLKDCGEAFGFAVTIGPNLEEKRDRYLEEKETARALALDAAGSVAAEELAALTHCQIKERAAQKHGKATMRFSPGYGDWPLSGQRGFLAWLGAKNIGIRLNEDFQMLPEKSVSAIVGIK
ncbi:MAG: vitamin B12 dependent-methionine synthase activation domain-containing protein [Endomicrobiales bacterium]